VRDRCPFNSGWDLKIHLSLLFNENKKKLEKKKKERERKEMNTWNCLNFSSFELVKTPDFASTLFPNSSKLDGTKILNISLTSFYAQISLSLPTFEC